MTVVGTDALNHVRYEPNLEGVFLRREYGTGRARQGGEDRRPQSSSHVPPATHPAGPAEAFPRRSTRAWSGTRPAIAPTSPAWSSNNVVVVDKNGRRTGRRQVISVGSGPTGLALDAGRGRLYVLNRFGASVSVVDLGREAETARVRFFDPTPGAIRAGRRHFYGTQREFGPGTRLLRLVPRRRPHRPPGLGPRLARRRHEVDGTIRISPSAATTTTSAAGSGIP